MIIEVGGQDVFVSNGGRDRQPGQNTLVLIHGSGMNHTEWALQNRFFSHRGINVFSIDLPGHGRSTGQPLQSVELISAWLDSFFTAANLRSATVLGHSLGALVTLHFAATCAERCERIILAGVTANMAVNPTLLNAARENDPLAIELLESWCNASGSLIGGHSVPGAWLSGATRRLLEAARKNVLYTDLNACDKYADAQQNFERIGAPLTVIAASEDKMTPARAAEKLAKSHAGAVFEVIKGAGHNMMVEKPDDFNLIVRDSMGV